MSEIDQFFKQAGKIHDMHIEKLNSADVEIAEKRIKKYFNGECPNLGWKSILYEINKLPELQRNNYIKDLVEQQRQKAIEEMKNNIKAMGLLDRIKFLANI